MKAEREKDGNDDEIETVSHVKRISARGPKMPCFVDRNDDMDAFCIDMKFMLIAKDEKKVNGHYICQHF